jgi:hypothetical protein
MLIMTIELIMTIDLLPDACQPPAGRNETGNPRRETREFTA